MQFINRNWSLKTIVGKKTEIDPQPQWQRGETWKLPKKQLLIDSILAGYDIPKIYLWEISHNVLYKYAVADGQQRLRSIWGFVEDSFNLATAPPRPWAGMSYAALPSDLRQKLDNFKLVVTVVQASEEEIRELFARLQKGVQLTPPQIRNSMASSLGTTIRHIAMSHPFFKDSVFSAEGFIRDDYLSHVFALELYGVTRDLKAPDLASMYAQYSQGPISHSHLDNVIRVLDHLAAMQSIIPRFLQTKWGFVDLSLYLLNKGSAPLDANKSVITYQDFERRRKLYVADPSPLISGTAHQRDRDLYGYIQAFKVGAGTSKAIITRNKALSASMDKAVK